MKILLSSYAFSPSVGGIETASALLATEFAAMGHTVAVITDTAEADGRSWPFEVHRRPSAWRLARLVHWCDVFFHNNISLRSAWPLLLFRRPWVVTHQTWSPLRLKHWLCRLAVNVAISQAVARTLPVPSKEIGNPYQDDLFKPIPTASREIDLVFLGRLVSDKGVDLLIEALALLRSEGLSPHLTIIGAGPEDARLRAQVETAGLGAQVHFAGPLGGLPLAEQLNRHHVLVVPSRWEEPFGIVALEGIACGCVVVASAGGGLAEAVGPSGLTFPNGDGPALAAALRRVLSEPALVQALRAPAATHLQRYTAHASAAEYLALFATLL